MNCRSVKKIHRKDKKMPRPFPNLGLHSLEIPDQIHDGRGTQRLRHHPVGRARRPLLRADRQGDGQGRQREEPEEMAGLFRLSSRLRVSSGRRGASLPSGSPCLRERSFAATSPMSTRDCPSALSRAVTLASSAPLRGRASNNIGRKTREKPTRSVRKPSRAMRPSGHSSTTPRCIF